MSLFRPAMNDQAYLKAGFYGSSGTGKTTTASLIATGIHRLIKSERPIGFIDTETGSTFVNKTVFEPAGIKLHVSKSRAFVDLLTAIREAEKAFDILVIDSITHMWRDYIKSYKVANRLKFIRIQDWGTLKERWAEYTDLYVNSGLHIIMCGRASNVFEDVEDEKDDDSEKKKFKAVKVGTKMAAEGETGYEPSLLVEMEKVYIGEGGKYVRRANVVKDRFMLIDSKEFDFEPLDFGDVSKLTPEKLKQTLERMLKKTFNCFYPHVAMLNLGGQHIGVDVTRNSTDYLKEPKATGPSIFERVSIATEEIQGVLTALWPGQDHGSKKIKADILEVLFKTRSWTAIEKMGVGDLEFNTRVLKAFEELSKPLMEQGKHLDWNSILEKLADAREMIRNALSPGAVESTKKENGELPF